VLLEPVFLEGLRVRLVGLEPLWFLLVWEQLVLVREGIRAVFDAVVS